MCIGTNNHSHTASEVAGGIVEICNTIREKQPDAEIIVLVSEVLWFGFSLHREYSSYSIWKACPVENAALCCMVSSVTGIVTQMYAKFSCFGEGCWGRK